MSTLPKLALIPSGYRAGTLYSVLPTDGVGDFDFSRSGQATRINKNGLIETVGSNVPRLNYPMIDGVVSGCPSLLLEPQRTNLVTYSESFDNAYWSKLTSDSTPVPVVTSNYATSPDGKQTAERVQLTLPTDNQYAIIRRTGVNPNTPVGSIVNQSIYLKATDVSQVGKKVDVYIYDTTNSTYRRILNHVLTNNWERVEVNHLISFGSTCTSVEYVFGKARANATGQDGTTGTITSEAATDFLVWGAQLEQSYATSYIPTNGSTVTRVAETANGAGDADTFNDSEGVLFAEISALADDLTYRSISISGHINLFYNNVSNTIVVSSTGGALIIKQLSDITSLNKIALKYKANDFALWVNGVELGTDTSATTSNSLTTLNYDNGVGGSKWYGSTKQIQYFDSALNDNELEELTSWKSFSEMATSQLYTIQ